MCWLVHVTPLAVRTRRGTQKVIIGYIRAAIRGIGFLKVNRPAGNNTLAWRATLIVATIILAACTRTEWRGTGNFDADSYQCKQEALVSVAASPVAQSPTGMRGSGIAQGIADAIARNSARARTYVDTDLYESCLRARGYKEVTVAR